MVDIKVARGVKADVPFRLKDRPGGNLIDDFHYVNGLTAVEWPTVVIRDGANADKTADFDVDITADTLPAGAIKHPVPSTGLWRLSKGQYRIRVQPLASLPLANYTMTVTFDATSSSAYPEPVTLVLVEAGDIEFGDLVFGIITWDDLTAIIPSSITDVDQQEAILAEMASSVEGDLEACGIDTTQWTEIPKVIRSLLLSYGRALLITYDASAGITTGPATEVQEGAERIKYAATTISTRLSPTDEYAKRLALICKRYGPGRQPFMQTVTKAVGHSVNDGVPDPFIF